MEVVLLGTAGAGGRPNAFCTCELCRTALATGDVRAQTSALVDGRLLLDCGPEVPLAATRIGRTLAGVRHLLVTHSHPDHAGPMALLARAWANRTEPLDLVGPPEALDVFADWIGPDDPVRPRPVRAGDRLDLGGYAVRVLAADHGDEHAGPGVLYDVTAPDGGRLLYATDTGPLPAATLEATSGRAYDVVLLEESFGDVTDHGTRHLDLDSFARAVRELRDTGAVTDGTDVVAVHLGHHDPPADELAHRLAEAGARVVPDGTVLGEPSARSAVTSRTLVLGGARSGKSVHAESLLAGVDDVVYVATGGTRAADPEWSERVARHQARRPVGWTTVETADVASLLAKADAGRRILVDCVSLWLAAVMDDTGLWQDEDGAAGELARRCDELVDAVRDTAATVVLVSNEVGSGVVPATVSGRRYRDELGRLNIRLAAVSDTVTLVVAGVPVDLRTAGREEST
jgi:adenosylcobinamide kinase/adenosylcobinamide-phosphate guanylyltransferase